MEKIFTKKNILIVSGVGVLVLLIWNYIGNYRICDIVSGNGSAGECPFFLTGIAMIFFPIFPLFFFSLLTYKMRQESYETWFRFARWWIPLSMILVLLAPEYSNDWMFPITKGSVAFITSILFTPISLILITWKWFTLRGKK